LIAGNTARLITFDLISRLSFSEEYREVLISP